MLRKMSRGVTISLCDPVEILYDLFTFFYFTIHLVFHPTIVLTEITLDALKCLNFGSEVSKSVKRAGSEIVQKATERTVRIVSASCKVA